MNFIRLKKIFSPLVLILFFSFLLRFWRLGEIPVGHTNDEANYIISAYSIWHTRRDLNGNYLPLSFNLFNSYSPVPIYLIAPFVGILGLTPFSSRLPFAILGVMFIYLTFLLTKKLFNNRFIALATAFTLAISPWHIQLSKIAYNGSLVLFFYTLGIYLFLIKKEKGNTCWALPAFFLGFYSYHGCKVFFCFIIPLLIFLFKDELLRRKKELFFFITGALLIILSFGHISASQDVTRQKVFLWNNLEEIGRVVNQERAINRAPNPLRIIFSNKILTSFQIIRKNYLQAFSPQYLFLYGEPGYNSEIYGLTSKYGHSPRGAMYIIELPLLLFGIFFLFNKTQKKIRRFLLIGLLISPLPSTFIIDESYGMRSVMMLLFLTILVGCGLFELATKLKKLRKRKVLYYSFMALFSFIYLFLLSEYLYQFYYRYKTYSAESWLRSKRDIVQFIGKEKNNYQNIYITNAGGLFIQYAIFNRLHPKIIQEAYKQNLPQVENVSFIEGCIKTDARLFDPNIHLPANTLYITHESCHKDSEVKPFKTIAEVGEPLHIIWKIYRR